MNAVSKLSSKGQLVVPKSVRDRHGWKAGDQIELIESGAVVFMRAIPAVAAGICAAEVFAKIDAIVANSRIAPIDDAEARALAVQSMIAADNKTRTHAD